MKRTEALHDVQLRLEPTFAVDFDRVDASEPVRSLRQMAKALMRGRVPDDFGSHVQTLARDLGRWQAGALPGAPIPVPRPEVLQRLAETSVEEVGPLLHALLGDVVGMGVVKLGWAAVEKVDVTAILQPAPNYDSRISLGEARDALGMRRVRFDWRLTEDDRRSIRRTLDLFAAGVGSSGLGRLQIAHASRNREWPEDLRGGWHHMGATRMSDDPRDGVVDRDCRVHGISNLFVAGSSVFPTAGSGSPTLSLVALALRLADHLKAGVLA